jgi:predicted AlkP superfamily phosphohydrolase/phosphomutase
MLRVALIGLDAGDGPLIADLIEQERLPTLARLHAESTRLRLKSVEPIGRVWETLLRGSATPYDMRVFDPATYETSWLGPTIDPPFYVTDPPLNVVAFDVPFLSLYHDVPGAQVAAWGGHNPGYPRAARPQGVLRDIDARFGHHPAFHDDIAEWYDEESLRELRSWLVEGAGKRADISRWLLSEFSDWELFTTVLSETHSAGESMWHGMDPFHPVASWPVAKVAHDCLEDVYIGVDDAVGRIIDALPPDVVTIVCSLHGNASDGGDLPTMVLLPEFLHRLEFGRPYLWSAGDADWKRRGCPPALPTQPSWKAELRIAEARARRAGWRGLLRHRSRQPSGLGGIASIEPIEPESPLAGEEIGRPVSTTDGHVAAWSRFRWPAMRAFALPSVYLGRVRLNVQGREAGGIVPVESYAWVRDEIESELRACRDPRTGTPVVADVERWDGDPFDMPNDQPDLLITWRGMADAFEHPRVGIVGPYPHRRIGGHTLDGWAMISGPGFGPAELGEFAAVDLAPTILQLLGRRPGAKLEGTPIPLP